MNSVIFKFLEKCVTRYLDNILIYLKNIEKHKEHIIYVLLKKMSHYNKSKKYQLLMEFLEYIIPNKGLLLDPKKIQAIMS